MIIDVSSLTRPNVIAIGTDLLINRGQFRFAYIRREIREETIPTYYTVLLVFNAGSNGELAVPHPDATSVDSIEKAREVLDEFHQALALSS